MKKTAASVAIASPFFRTTSKTTNKKTAVMVAAQGLSGSENLVSPNKTPHYKNIYIIYKYINIIAFSIR